MNTLQLRLGAERPLAAVGLDEQVGIREQWRTALGLLTPADQEVLALVAWDGSMAREAAASLGCSVPAVVMRLHQPGDGSPVCSICPMKVRPGHTRDVTRLK